MRTHWAKNCYEQQLEEICEMSELVLAQSLGEQAVWEENANRLWGEKQLPWWVYLRAAWHFPKILRVLWNIREDANGCLHYVSEHYFESEEE